MIGDNGLQVEPGDNAKFLAVSMKLMGFEKVDLKDADAVVERLNEFFKLYMENDMKPTVAGMAMALGVPQAELRGLLQQCK